MKRGSKPIPIRSRTNRHDPLKIGPCVQKARAPMNPKIACSCMRQLWEPEPKGTRHTEPSSVDSSPMDMVQNDRSVGARTLSCSTANAETVSLFLLLLLVEVHRACCSCCICASAFSCCCICICCCRTASINCCCKAQSLLHNVASVASSRSQSNKLRYHVKRFFS